MSIRCAAKAIILHENKVLLNKSHREDSGDYYALPGGGQNQYETMADAVIRECLEETGYSVIPETLVAVHEEIYVNPEFQRHHPEHSHKIFHIFRCSLASEEKTKPLEMDTNQTGSCWIYLADVPGIRLFPARVHERFLDTVKAVQPLYLGSAEVTS